MKGPMLKVTGLWAKSSVKGGQYLTGRLGAVKVLVMENRDRKSDDPSHHLFFVEAPDRRHCAQECGGGQRAPAEPRTNPRPSQSQQSVSQTHAIAEDDDVPSWER
jgi:hypothetical protein